ncbi:MAG TPA: ABC transporter ATP-binding protein [Myxococcales bacterium]|nr:ABC transporter ATP-binding protein [Myxococcales bacterium]
MTAEAPALPSPDGPILEVLGLGKSFGELRACDGISFSLRRGEVLALVGENGAGKTTLLNLVMGLYRPDAGEVRVRGQAVHLACPADAEALGLGMVHQHFTLVGPLTVAENVVLGREPQRLGLLDRARAEREVEAVSRRHGLPIRPAARLDELSVAGRQRVEILKVLWRGAELLAFDEPTAALSPAEADALCRAIRQLRDAGKAILFVSHKLREVQAVADRIAVLRAGRLVAAFEAKGADPAQVAAAMVGDVGPPADRPAPERPAVQPPRAAPPTSAAPILSLADVHCLDARGAPALRGVTLSILPGEVVGVAGVDGNGQRELAELCTGLRRPASGTVTLAGKPAPHLDPATARALGVAHVPEDRDRGGLCGALTLAENLALGRAWRPPFRKGHLLARLDRAGLADRAGDLLRRFDVRPPDPEARASSLSGGNQQKVVLARELDGAPRLVVAVHPTRGLDLHASRAVRERLREQAGLGAGLLIVSFDLDELREIADRLVVLCGGRITGEARPADVDDATLSRWMAGASEAAA